MYENTTFIKIKRSKPRARQLNEDLLARKGGRMKNPRDFDRNQLKRDKRDIFNVDDNY